MSYPQRSRQSQLQDPNRLAAVICVIVLAFYLAVICFVLSAAVYVGSKI